MSSMPYALTAGGVLYLIATGKADFANPSADVALTGTVAGDAQHPLGVAGQEQLLHLLGALGVDPLAHHQRPRLLVEGDGLHRRGEVGQRPPGQRVGGPCEDGDGHHREAHSLVIIWDSIGIGATRHSCAGQCDQ